MPPQLVCHPVGATSAIVLNLHLNFYSALILLHRPQIPGRLATNTGSIETSFPSHQICTASAAQIVAIIGRYSSTHTLRHAPPTVIFPLFSAAIMMVYNCNFSDSLAESAKSNLRILMNALLGVSRIWGAAHRAHALLQGLVDLREAQGDSNAPSKRVLDVPLYTRPTSMSRNRSTDADGSRRRRSSVGRSKLGDTLPSSVNNFVTSPTIQEASLYSPPKELPRLRMGHMTPQSFEILGEDMAHFSPHALDSMGSTSHDFTGLFESYLTSTGGENGQDSSLPSFERGDEAGGAFYNVPSTFNL